MNRQASLVVVLAALISIGLILGVGLVEDPEVVIPLSLEFLLLLGVTAFVVRGERDPGARSFLTGLAAAGILARVGALFVVYGVLAPEFFAPDSATYRGLGGQLWQSWQGLGSGPDTTWQSSYVVFNAVAHGLLGDARYGMAVLNLFVGVWSAILAYRLGRTCFGEAAGRATGVLVAIFPSLVLWSVLNIRDALATFVVTALALLAVRIYRRVSGPDLLLMVVGLLYLSSLRDYMAVLLLGGVLLGFALALRPGRLVPTLVAGVVLVLGGIFLLERSQVLSPDILEDPLRSAAGMRRNLQQDFVSGQAGSAFGTGYDTSTVGGAIRYLPVGLAFFLFAPFPWAITSVLQLSTLPEVLLWYALVPFTLLGLRGIRTREHSVGLVLVGILAIVVTSYALVEGNFGTAYRHRSQVLPLFFVFAGRGLADWWQARRARSRRRAERAAAAQAALLGGTRTSWS